jgi:formylglycine-generating enzyme required for sulfatase activity
MDKQFIAIIQKLLAEQGKDALNNTSRFKSFLADYFSLTGTEYQKECRLLVQAIEAGVGKALNSTQELAICKKQQVKILQEEHLLAEEVAVDVVDVLGLILRGDTSITQMADKASEGAPVSAVLPPRAPQNVRAGSPGTDRVTLYWDGTGTIHRVYYNTLNDPVHASSLDNLATGLSMDITGMASGMTYYFWVSTVQDGQESRKSPVVSVLTAAAVPEKSAPSGMVWIAGGTFMMGSPGSEVGRRSDETQHQVTISRGFYMGKYAVTVGDFHQFVDATGYKTSAETFGGGLVWTGSNWVTKVDANWRNPYFTQNDNHPVVLISWNDGVKYCNWRSEREGLSPAYMVSGTNVAWNRSADGYRLPTEAEWEYACRAGTTSPFNTGNNIMTEQANYNGNNPYNGNAKGTYRKGTTAVGSFAANDWGLYDMHGNVWEWCWDWYGDYASDSQTDPTGAASGAYRMERGGSWIIDAECLRSAHRHYFPPGLRYSSLGFRVVCP